MGGRPRRARRPAGRRRCRGKRPLLPLREQVHQALTLLGAPAAPKLIIAVHEAFHVGELAPARLTSLRRDEERSFRSAPHSRPYYLCSALTADLLAPARGLLAVSTWPMATRVIGPLSPARRLPHRGDPPGRASGPDPRPRTDRPAAAVAVRRQHPRRRGSPEAMTARQPSPRRPRPSSRSIGTPTGRTAKRPPARPRPARRRRATLRRPAAENLRDRHLTPRVALASPKDDRWTHFTPAGPHPRHGRRETHNARTIAALTSNPGCARRAVMDAAGVDKERPARHVGFPAKFGQSRFAITRGNAFEAQVKAERVRRSCSACCARSWAWTSARSAPRDLDDVGRQHQPGGAARPVPAARSPPPRPTPTPLRHLLRPPAAAARHRRQRRLPGT